MAFLKHREVFCPGKPDGQGAIILLTAPLLTGGTYGAGQNRISRKTGEADPLLYPDVYNQGRVRSPHLVPLCDRSHGCPDVRRFFPLRSGQSGASQQRSLHSLEGSRFAPALRPMDRCRSGERRRTDGVPDFRKSSRRPPDAPISAMWMPQPALWGRGFRSVSAWR